MKKVLLVLLVAVASVVAEVWSLEPRAAATWYLTEGSVAVVDSSCGSRGSLKFSTGATLLFAERIGLYFDTDIYTGAGNKSLRPKFAEFRCGLESRVTKNIRLRFEHSCGHPIQSFNQERSLRYFTGYNSISISYGYGS